MTDAPPVERSAVTWLLGRGRGPQTAIAAAIVVLSLTLGLFHFYSTYFGQAEGHTHRSMHVAFMAVLAYLFYPLGRSGFAAPLTWHFALDLAAIGVIVGSQAWTLVHIHRFVDPNYTATLGDVVLGTLLIVAVLEATRRAVGLGLTLTAVFFLVQTWHADHFYWILYGPPTPWWTMVEAFFGKEEGLYGIPTAIMSSVLILFIFFSAFLSTTGVGDFFVRLATAAAGRLVGGPAKVAVFSSALFGTISGSGVANVMITGTFTIPMMKRVGYGSTFAGAVEATASLGGQIMPPIMAAAAFIMAEYTGIEYRDIAIAALLPALLYYVCVYAQVHFRAVRLGLGALDRSQIPSLVATLRKGSLFFVPLIVLVTALLYGYTPTMVAIMGTVAVIIVSWLKRETRLRPIDLWDALADTVYRIVPVAGATAAALSGEPGRCRAFASNVRSSRTPAGPALMPTLRNWTRPSPSSTTKSNPASPIISTPWPVGVLRNVPTSVWRASTRARKPVGCVIRCARPCQGIGYSAAFSTQPGFSEKSLRGGQKMSTSWLVPGPTASVVWMEGGGMTARDGVPHSSC